MNNAIVENRRAVMSLMQGGFHMDWVKHPSNIDAWNPATDEGDAPPIPPKTYGDGVPAPVIDSIVPVVSGGAIRLRATVSDPGEGHALVLRWQPSGTPMDVWSQQAITGATVVGGMLIGDTGTVPANVDLDVQVAFQAAGGTLSDWRPASPLVVHTTLDSTPPGAVTDESVTPGAGLALFAWRSPNSPNYVGARIYVNTVDNFRTASLLVTEFGAPNASQTSTPTLDPDSYYGWIVSINGSGVEGTPVPVGTFTVT